MLGKFGYGVFFRVITTYESARNGIGILGFCTLILKKGHVSFCPSQYQVLAKLSYSQPFSSAKGNWTRHHLEGSSPYQELPRESVSGE